MWAELIIPSSAPDREADPSLCLQASLSRRSHPGLIHWTRTTQKQICILTRKTEHCADVLPSEAQMQTWLSRDWRIGIPHNVTTAENTTPKTKDSDKQTASCSDSQKKTSRRPWFLGQSDAGGGIWGAAAGLTAWSQPISFWENPALTPKYHMGYTHASSKELCLSTLQI